LTDRLDAMAWPAVAAVASGRLLVLPLGSTEQHGPHLPCSTDTDIAVALADALASRRSDVVVAPALPYGAAGEHAGFAGTLSLGTTVLEQVLVEVVRSADAFAGVVIVCGHGGNADAVNAAVGRLRDEGRRVLAWAPSVPGGDAHAGRTETSLLLALRPEAVALDRVEAGALQPVGELLPALRAGGVVAVSANGVLGDPSQASAAEGLQLLHDLTDALVAAVEAWAA
jgi:mycofactocin system creatininase family protein